MRRHSLLSPFHSYLPVLIGALVAVFSTIILRISILWAFLFLIGLTTAVMSLVFDDFKTFWLSVYALVLPLEIKKMLIDSSFIEEMVMRYGFPVGELPGPVIYLSDLPLTVLIGIWIYEIVKEKRIFFPPSNLMALFFIAWSGISAFKAPDTSLAAFEFVRLLKFYVLYLYIANNIDSKKRLEIVFCMFFIGLILQGLLCISQFIMKDAGMIFLGMFGDGGFLSSEFGKKLDPFFSIVEGGSNRKRASGTAGAANAAALYFEFLIPFAFITWLVAKKYSDRLFKLTALSLGTIGLVLTFSRGGLIGLVSGFALSVILARIFNLISRKTFLVFLLIMGISMVLVSPFIYDYLMTRPEASSVRFHLNRVGFAMIKENPVLGVGLNNHLIVKPQYDPRSYFFQMPTHNHFILMASQSGIPGLIFFLGFLFKTFHLSFKLLKNKDPYISSIATGIIVAFFSVCVHIQADYLGTYTALSLLWFFSGLAASLYQNQLDSVSKANCGQI